MIRSLAGSIAAVILVGCALATSPFARVVMPGVRAIAGALETAAPSVSGRQEQGSGSGVRASAFATPAQRRVFQPGTAIWIARDTEDSIQDDLCRRG
ncbi:MAG: hypothetical protein KGL52_13685 [Rhodospirillales bacterium]|nr:hypothetical protein [Rhodospirillales bacterium]